MPTFNPDVKGFDAEPNYLRYSRGVGANNATGDAIKNAGKLFESGVDVYNDAEKTRTTDAIKKDVSGLFNENIDATAPQPLQQKQPATEPEGTGNSWKPTLVSNTTDKELPDSADGGVDQLKGLNQAYQSGRISESYYWGAKAAAVSQLKARYPAYSDAIDQMVKKTTGHEPAGMYIKAQFKAQQDAYKEQQSADKAVESYIRNHPDDAPTDYWDRKLQGNPYPLAQAEAYTAKNIAARQKIDWQKKQLLEARAERQDTTDLGSRTLNNELQGFTDRMLTDGTDALGSKFQQAWQTVQTKGKNSSPEELQTLESSLQAIQLGWDSKVHGILSAPWAGDSTKNYYTELDPKAIDAVKKEARERLTTYSDLIRNHDYGVLAVHAQNVKRLEDADKQQFLEKQPIARLATTMKALNLNDAFQNAIGPGGQNEVKTPYANAANFSNLFGAASDPKADSLKTNIQNIAKAQADENNKGPAARTLVTGKDYQSILGSYTQMLKDPSLPNAGFKNLVTNMFDERNHGFLSLFRPADQQKVFQTVLNPDVTKRVAEYSKSDPSVWEKYKAFALDGFQSTMSSSLSEIGELSKDLNYDIHYDPASNRFVYQPTARAVAMYGPGGYRSSHPNAANMPPIPQRTVNAINAQLQILEPILKQDKTPVADQIAAVLRAKGVPLEATPEEAKSGTFLQKLAAAIGPALSAGATTDEYHKGDTGAALAAWENPGRNPMKNPFKPDTGAYEPAKGIDLTPDKLAPGHEHQGLLKTIGHAESGGDYGQVFGGKNIPDMQDHTLDEVMGYQKLRAKSGVPSTAVGKYQFLRSTLQGLKDELGLTGQEHFTPELQDRLAMALLHRRGLGDYESGKLNASDFAGRLAKEFAGLPTASGKSYYHGDGLNASTIKHNDLLRAIESVKHEKTY